MIALIQQTDGSYQEEERGEPVCGQDFCNACGDCLACYGDDVCYESDDRQHRGVIDAASRRP